MNNIRRKKLAKLYEEIENIKFLLEEVTAEEQDAFDNIPENLEGTKRYEKAEETIENLEEAVNALEDVLEYIDCAQE